MNVNGKSNPIAKKDSKEIATLKSTIMQMTGQFKSALPTVITPERMARIAMTAVSNNQDLARCSQESFFGALLTGAQLGLEPNTPLGQCYLIPFNVKGRMTCQFQLGYQGLIELAYRSGKYKNIQARIVYKGDSFEYSYGMDEYVNHVPMGKTDTPTHVYAYYTLVNGGGTFEVMTWQQVLHFSSQYSFAVKKGYSSPWKSDPEAMAKKTLLKKLLKFAPKSVEVSEALSYDSGVLKVASVPEGANNVLTHDVDYTMPELEQAPGKKPLPEAKEQAQSNHTQKDEQSNRPTEQDLIDDEFEAQAEQYEQQIPDELF